MWKNLVEVCNFLKLKEDHYSHRYISHAREGCLDEPIFTTSLKRRKKRRAQIVDVNKASCCGECTAPLWPIIFSIMHS